VTLIGDKNRKLSRAAVCVGAAGRLPLEMPRSRDCDVVITGEIRHHDALTLLRLGKTAVALGHWESERPVLRPLAKAVSQHVGGIQTLISKSDAPPARPPQG
jgi:putative NIF3 family GTP cyclohydrolase 1 type 2